MPAQNNNKPASPRLTRLLAGLVLGICLYAIPSSAQAFCFEEAGARYGISPHVLYGIAKAESGLKPDAINWNKNKTYDYGLMQINTIHEPMLKKAGIKWESLADPCTNVMVGAWILSQRIQEYGYNWKGIGAYHSKTPEKRDRYAHIVAKKIYHSP